MIMSRHVTKTHISGGGGGVRREGGGGQEGRG